MISTVNFNDFCDSFTGSYKNSFSYEGKQALFDYLEELEDGTEEQIELDPVGFAVTYTEYKDFDEFQHDNGYIQDGVEHLGYDDIANLDGLRDHTTVIEFDGGIIVEDF